MRWRSHIYLSVHTKDATGQSTNWRPQNWQWFEHLQWGHFPFPMARSNLPAQWGGLVQLKFMKCLIRQYEENLYDFCPYHQVHNHSTPNGQLGSCKNVKDTASRIDQSEVGKKYSPSCHKLRCFLQMSVGHWKTQCRTYGLFKQNVLMKNPYRHV